MSKQLKDMLKRSENATFLEQNSCFDEFNTFIIQKCVIYINGFWLEN